MENERFQLQNVAKTVEMAASSSKMLQLARETCRKTDPTRKRNGENNPKQFRTLLYHNIHSLTMEVQGFFCYVQHNADDQAFAKFQGLLNVPSQP